MESIPTEIKIKAHSVCSDYLGGSWRSIKQDEIIVEKVAGGYSNLTLKISLPSNHKPIEEEPSQVIMKNHLDVLGEGYFKQMTENVIAVALAEKTFFPKVYGVIDGGHLDEYIISRPLDIIDFRNPVILSPIARKLAHLDTVNLSINKDSNKMCNQIERLLESTLSDPRNILNDPKREAIVDNLMSLKPNEELKWLQEKIDTINSPVVYCHGDLQINNILLQKNSPNDLIYIIDLDVSGYNYRGFDFGSLMNMICLEAPYPEPPYFKCDWGQFPSLEEHMFIFDTYLKEFQKINNITLDIDKEKQSLLKECKVFSLLLCLLVITVSLSKQDNVDANKFDWLVFGDTFLKRYKEQKKIWFEET